MSQPTTSLGFAPFVTPIQWSAIVKTLALGGVSPERATQAALDEGRAELVAAIGRHRPEGHGVKALTAALFGAQTTLFHLGNFDVPHRKTNRDRSAERASEWKSVPPRLASTFNGYIDQVALSLRASTMVRVEGVLREFATWLAVNTPEVCCVADVRRAHIEAYKLHLAARPSARGGTLTKTSLAEHLGDLHPVDVVGAAVAGGDLLDAGDLGHRFVGFIG